MKDKTAAELWDGVAWHLKWMGISMVVFATTALVALIVFLL